MKKNINTLLIILATFLACSLNSCRVAPTNSDLDAQWQLMTIETGSQTIVVDNPRVYYSFYRHTATLTSSSFSTNANLSYDGSTLKLEFPGQNWASLAKLHLTPPAQGAEQASYPVVTFNVVKLTGKQLILSLADDNKTYTFRKY